MKNQSQLEDLRRSSTSLEVRSYNSLDFLEGIPLGHIKTKLIEYGAVSSIQWVNFLHSVHRRMSRNYETSFFISDLLHPTSYIMLSYMRDTLAEWDRRLTTETVFLLMALEATTT